MEPQAAQNDLRILRAFQSQLHTVFPQIRPAGIIFLLGLQLRVLLERGYYSRASINFSMCKFEKIKPANIVKSLHKFT